MDGMNEEQTPK